MLITPSPIVDLLLLAICGLFLVHFRLEQKRGHWMLLDPFNAFWGGVLVCYVFQPISYFETLVSNYSEGIVIQSLFAVLWGLIWVMVGYHKNWGVKVGVKLPQMPRELHPGLFTWAGLVMVGLGLVGYAILISTAGSLDAWLATGRGATKWQEVSGYLAILEYFLPVGIMILLFRVEVIKTPGLFRTMVWSLAALQWLWLVYLGSRSRTILFLMTMASVFYIPRRKNPPLIPSVVAAVVLFFLVSFQAQYRGQFTNLSFNLDRLDWGEVMTNILPHSLGGKLGEKTGQSLGDLEFNCVAAVVDTVPDVVPYNYGYTLAELGTRIIPRAFWPNKIYPLYEAQSPVMQERRLSGQWYVTPTSRFLVGPSFTYIGYWYHAGGYVALVLAGLYTGAFFRAMRMYFDRDPLNQGNIILYVMLLPIGFQELASTPFYWVFTTSLVIAPAVILMFMARQGKNEHAPELVPYPA